MTLTPTELIAGCISQDAAARTEFVERFQRNIASVLVKMACRSGAATRELLQDLTQETYVRIFDDSCRVLRNLRSHDERSVAAHVQSIAYSVGCDHFRRSTALKRGGAHRLDSIDDEAAPEPAAAQGDDQMLRSILFSEIDRALAEVTDETSGVQQRHVFWLYFRHGFTARDISQLPSCQLSVKGVESLLLRLTQGVRQKLASPRTSREGKRPSISSGGSEAC